MLILKASALQMRMDKGTKINLKTEEYNIPAEYYIPLISNLRYLYPCKSK